MPTVIPNLHFHGRCREALDLYRRALGAEVTLMLHYSDAKPADFQFPRPLTEEQKGYVYHAEMEVGGQRLMCSDSMAPVPRGQNLSLVIVFPDPEDVKAAYSMLQTGGTVLVPPSDLTYSSCFASVIDRYGMRWELMTEDK